MLKCDACGIVLSGKTSFKPTQQRINLLCISPLYNINVYEIIYFVCMFISHTSTRHCCAPCVYICVFKLIIFSLFCSLSCRIEHFTFSSLSFICHSVLHFFDFFTVPSPLPFSSSLIRHRVWFRQWSVAPLSHMGSTNARHKLHLAFQIVM